MNSISNGNELSKAAALQYDGQNAPKLVAKGVGDTAKAIIAQAQAHDIHLHQDPILLEVLSKLELGDEIPNELYLAVAKIIAFAYFLQGKHPDNLPNKEDLPTPTLLEHSQDSNDLTE